MAALLKGLPDELPENVTLAGLMDKLGDKAIAFVLLVFAIPAIIPTPGIPAGMIFGTALAILSLQIIFGSRRLVLPGFLGRLSVSRSLIQMTADRAAPRLEKLEALLRPRGHVLSKYLGHVAIGVVIFLMAVLIALPIPFGNMLPGLAVLAIALGLAQRDDVAVLVGLLLAVLSVLTSVAIIYGGWALISGWLGLGQPAA
ncbi:exopolysaccharide biosynthesis protein [Agrobacterium rubi]|uniref:Exopolysaccharide biosynthesis protein n=1 Tax=Agrobacterium rubi TaxID=28099 RepID=A0AAE7UPS6_9HYPH|nr:exopolysaccharide biosynthesis protein [Agrobacterium rubi]NTE86952.1 exopolysaccharide biosynthesis protein [Agrobacterium rubi]NTF02886.1 exopolysaccharide biosynthesis protein [Agrobacterium rubi]NTF37130.1 exopolysaccharide biosynthesis protein [Agrobacterium rubi]QTF99561.1 exopolysaccharide biosynthesis protein [Agrobacterium rubi]